jgi:hypothetical protein
MPLTFTSREPGLLNHYLRYPRPGPTGWLLEREGRVRGFALLWVSEKPHGRVGRIADCFLDSDDLELWGQAVTGLLVELKKLRCDLVSCFGSTPWLAQALLSNGFIRRGRTVFYLRDTAQRLPAENPFHLTHLEADSAYA